MGFSLLSSKTVFEVLIQLTHTVHLVLVFFVSGFWGFAPGTMEHKAHKALWTRFCGQHFFKKTMVNSVHIWSVDLVHVEDDTPGSSLFKSHFGR